MLNKVDKAAYDVIDFIENHEAIQFSLSKTETAKLKSLIFRLVSLWHDSINNSKNDSFYHNRIS